MREIKCPYDLNQFILGEPIFENPFPEEECEKRKFYGDCYHCFSTAIASRDNQLKASVTAQQKMGRWERDHFTNQPTCSECGYKVFGERTNYCPACGSKNIDV